MALRASLASLLFTLLVGCGNSASVAPDAAAPADRVAATDRTAPDVTDSGVDVGMDARVPCHEDRECVGDPAGAVCDAPSGRCVACRASADTCSPETHCDDTSHACVAGCRSDEGCARAFADAGTDAPAMSSPDGSTGVAAPICDRTDHRCVVCLTDAQCPPGTLCMGRACVPGCDERHDCATGQSCCGGGCVDTQHNTANCGACGRVCATPVNGSPSCAAGACGVGACGAGYGDCDRDPANGCETSTLTSLAHCGGCGLACTSGPNATAECSFGTCRQTCMFGFGDCDGNPANGCETDVNATEANCGACGRTCAPGLACNFGTCSAAICCADLHARLPSLPTGVYPLAGDTGTYPAYCDMTTDGGGWTLTLMLADTPVGAYGFDNESWTDGSVVNPEVTDPTRNVFAKSQGYYRVPVLSEIKFCVGSMTRCVSELRFASSTQSLFLGDEIVSTHTLADLGAWGAGPSTGCARVGFNVRVSGSPVQCRYGAIVNRTGTCGGTEDGGFGFGCNGYHAARLSAGWADGISSARHERGWILVR